MNKNLQKATVLLVGSILTSGCTTYWRSTPWGIADVRKDLMKLELGMTKQEVIKIMGSPYSREVEISENGEKIEFFEYITTYVDSGPVPSDYATPILFINGKVAGWGRNFYKTHKQRYEIEIK